MITRSPKLANALAKDLRPDSLTSSDVTTLSYVLKLMRDSDGMTADDAEVLRAAEFDGRVILDVLQVASYYNYVNCLADGLGVKLDEHWRDEDCTLTRDEFVAMREARRVKTVTVGNAAP